MTSDGITQVCMIFTLASCRLQPTSLRAPQLAPRLPTTLPNSEERLPTTPSITPRSVWGLAAVVVVVVAHERGVRVGEFLDPARSGGWATRSA
jgi:hypothetical protein